jgi:hypothetical protein
MKKILLSKSFVEEANTYSIQAVVAIHIDREINFECHNGKIDEAYLEG